MYELTTLPADFCLVAYNSVTMSIDINIITKFPLFSSLSQPTLEAVQSCITSRSCLAGEVIQLEGEEFQWVGFVQKGALQVYRSIENGREQVLHTVGPGMHFNAIPALQDRDTLMASIRALTPTTFFIIERDDYRHLLQNNTDFGFVMLKDLARRLVHLTGLVEDLSLRSVRGRLARFLLSQADGQVVSTLWTQDEIAAQLGTVRDVVGRTLRGYIDAGLIRREGPRLLLVDRQKLEEEANS